MARGLDKFGTDPGRWIHNAVRSPKHRESEFSRLGRLQLLHPHVYSLPNITEKPANLLHKLAHLFDVYFCWRWYSMVGHQKIIKAIHSHGIILCGSDFWDDFLYSSPTEIRLHFLLCAYMYFGIWFLSIG